MFSAGFRNQTILLCKCTYSGICDPVQADRQHKGSLSKSERMDNFQTRRRAQMADAKVDSRWACLVDWRLRDYASQRLPHALGPGTRRACAVLGKGAPGSKSSGRWEKSHRQRHVTGSENTAAQETGDSVAHHLLCPHGMQRQTAGRAGLRRPGIRMGCRSRSRQVDVNYTPGLPSEPLTFSFEKRRL